MSIIILSLTGFYPRKKVNNYSDIVYKWKGLNKTGEQYKIIEYPLILLFIIIGSILLISTNDIISIFLSIELQSYGLYLLCTLYRNSESATSAGLTYFLLGGLSSCFILLGFSLLYANSGITNLDGLYIITSISEVLNKSVLYNDYGYNPYYIHFSLLIMCVGFLFKVSAAPFHFWAPDVYDAIPTIVTTFVAIIPKISIFIFILNICQYSNGNIFNLNWTLILLISSFFSLIIGTIVGLTQFRIKRLYAYSTISHLGFILLSLSIYSLESIQAFIFYLVQYSLSNLNAFILLICMGYSLYFYINNNEQYNNLLDKNNSPIQLISQIKGYFNINPILALSLAITLFSFVGIPPLIGFFAKQMVLSSAIDSGFIFMSIIAIITSVISAVYYLAIIKQIFFEKPDYILNPVLNIYMVNNKGILLSSSLSIVISILTFIIILFMFIPQEWLGVANILALKICNI
jgi:NADH-ubiquinone oxidoreductase chain 2